MLCGNIVDRMRMMSMHIRTYSELIRIPTFEERYEYLKLNGIVSDVTFGSARWLNQSFYSSKEWRRIRDQVILRDMGRDLAMPGYELDGEIYIHHMNVITLEDLENYTPLVYNPEYLITTSFTTHQAIHYGSSDQLPSLPVERYPGDTCPWKQKINAEKE